MTTKKRKTTTKSDLKAALTRLLKQKDFEAISVSDIAKEPESTAEPSIFIMSINLI